MYAGATKIVKTSGSSQSAHVIQEVNLPETEQTGRPLLSSIGFRQEHSWQDRATPIEQHRFQAKVQLTECGLRNLLQGA